MILLKQKKKNPSVHSPKEEGFDYEVPVKYIFWCHVSEGAILCPPQGPSKEPRSAFQTEGVF